MGRVWVLQTETKGTGANMVPLERVLKKPSPAAEPVFVPRKPTSRPAPAPEPRPARRFKVVDVMTRELLADAATTQETIDALKGARSIVDVMVYIWKPDDERWRMLTVAEQQALWQLKDA